MKFQASKPVSQKAPILSDSMVPMSVDEILVVRDLIEAYGVRDIGLGLNFKINRDGKISNKEKNWQGFKA